MDHGPAAKLEVDLASKKKSKLGIILFIFYSLFYAGFIAIGVTNYNLFGKIVLGGQNLAVVYGFSLIVVAIIMGLIYHFICNGYEKSMNKEGES